MLTICFPRRKKSTIMLPVTPSPVPIHSAGTVALSSRAGRTRNHSTPTPAVAAHQQEVRRRLSAVLDRRRRQSHQQSVTDNTCDACTTTNTSNTTSNSCISPSSNISSRPATSALSGAATSVAVAQHYQIASRGRCEIRDDQRGTRRR